MVSIKELHLGLSTTSITFSSVHYLPLFNINSCRCLMTLLPHVLAHYGMQLAVLCLHVPFEHVADAQQSKHEYSNNPRQQSILCGLLKWKQLELIQLTALVLSILWSCMDRWCDLPYLEHHFLPLYAVLFIWPTNLLHLYCMHDCMIWQKKFKTIKFNLVEISLHFL